MTSKDKPRYVNPRRLGLKCPQITFLSVGLFLNVILCFKRLDAGAFNVGFIGSTCTAIPVAGDVWCSYMSRISGTWVALKSPLCSAASSDCKQSLKVVYLVLLSSAETETRRYP